MAKILLGVSGSIAAYKAADLASKLTQAGHSVSVLMTQAACQLVSPNTFLNLTGNKVYTDLWDPHGQTQHIALTDAAQLFVLAPATANTIAKLALGLGDDMISTTLLAVNCPVLVCPAMNVRMWSNPVVQRNLAAVQEAGHQVMPPDSGNLACGHIGPGRLAEPEAIAAEVERLLGETPAPPATAGGLFFEMVAYDKAPGEEELERERAFRAHALGTGALIASGQLAPNRWGHIHRAATLDDALSLARSAPLASGKVSIHVFPWSLEDGSALI